MSYNINNSSLDLEEDPSQVFSDLSYICGSTGLITEALQRGFDVAQMPNGDVIVTEVRTVNTHYSWDKSKNKMIKINQS